MADKKFNGYAALKAGPTVEPFSYTPRPLGANDVEIKITHCGVCHSDVHQITDGWKGSNFPMLPGHEIVGNITAVGPSVKGLKIGERVGVGPNCWSCLKSDCDACSIHEECLCNHKVDTYNGRYPDGAPSFGGYADNVRVLDHFVFKIPDALSSEGAAPLLCAGITTFTPLRVYNVKAGDEVAVMGLGGLGHLGLQWAVALGAKVTVISTSNKKESYARSMGAVDYIVLNDEAKMQAKARHFKLILACGSGADMKWRSIMSMLKIDGTCCLVGLPEEDLKVPPFALVDGRKNLSGSSVGGAKRMNEMLEFAAKHKIEAKVQVFPLAQVNEALKGVAEGKPEYRYVLKM